MLPGAANCGGSSLSGRPSMYAFMKSIQIGSAANAPCSAPPSDLRLSSNPSQTPTVISGSKPMNQASVLSSTVPVLPASGQDAPGSSPLAAGAARAEDAAQHVGHDEGGIGADHVVGFGAVFLEQVAVAILYVQDGERLHPHALIRERRVGAGDVEQRRVAGAKRNRQVGRKILLEPESLRELEHVLGPERVHHLDRGNIARFLERVAQRDRSQEFVVVVVRAVDLPVAGGIAHRRVDDDRRRGKAAVDRGGVDDRLERRSELTVRLHRAVELAAR